MLGAPAPHSTDRRLAWEQLRGHDWVAVAAIAGRDANARTWIVPTLRAWNEQHPIGRSIAWESAMEAALRIFSLVAVGGLAGPHPLYARMIFEHAEFVSHRLSAHSSANNHLIIELAALVLAWRVSDLPRQHSETLGRLEVAIAAQLFADGVHVEMATHYHAFVLEALAIVAACERWFGAAHRWLDTTIAAMSDYLAAIRCGDGSLLQQGDDDGGRVVPGFALPAGSAETRSRHFAASGQIVLRSPRVHAALDAGPFGFGSLAAHAHCDALALYLAIDGAPLLVDRGTYRYTDDHGMRDRLRGTAAHSTLQVGALEQADVRGPFLWGRRPTVVVERADLGDRDVVIASHDGFAPAIHRRRLVRDGDALLVVDRADTAYPLTARFHLPPGIEAAIDGQVVRTPRGWFEVTGTPTLTTTPHSPRYDVLESAITIEVRGQRELACVIGPGSYDPVIARALLAARED
ncbi:MAG TPA: alginate lyase family protein [Kofleriaceae bacterium]